jgi:hypothetical protein
MKPQEILIKLRAEFDYLWKQHSRDNWFVENMDKYCIALECLILNRLDEAKLHAGQFGYEGVAGLNKKELPNPNQLELDETGAIATVLDRVFVEFAKECPHVFHDTYKVIFNRCELQDPDGLQSCNHQECPRAIPFKQMMADRGYAKKPIDINQALNTTFSQFTVECKYFNNGVVEGLCLDVGLACDMEICPRLDSFKNVEDFTEQMRAAGAEAAKNIKIKGGLIPQGKIGADD